MSLLTYFFNYENTIPVRRCPMVAARFKALLESIIPDVEERTAFTRNFRKLVASEEFAALERHGKPVRGFVFSITSGDRISGNHAVNHVG